MLYKYSVLKSSWGIVVFLDMEEVLNPDVSSSDIQIATGIYLRVSDTKKIVREKIIRWVGGALSTLISEIYKNVSGVIVCYDLKHLDFNYVDFQEEGLFCATREWLAKYYNFEIDPIQVDYDKEKNKYVFNLPPFLRY